MLHEGKLYVLTDSGMLSCFDAKTGKAYYHQTRLPKPYNFKASPVGVNGRSGVEGVLSITSMLKSTRIVPVPQPTRSRYAMTAGDSESAVTLPLHPPQVELLKVAHHGSSDTGLGELLEAIRPKIALISVGEGNDYGHPAPSTLSALAASPGLAVYRTDDDGRVTVESDGTTFSVRTQR